MTDSDLVEMKFYAPIVMDDVHELISNAGEGAFTGQSMYEKYRSIATANGSIPSSRKMFTIAMKDLGIAVVRSVAKRGWLINANDIQKSKNVLRESKAFKMLVEDKVKELGVEGAIAELIKEPTIQKSVKKLEESTIVPETTIKLITDRPTSITNTPSNTEAGDVVFYKSLSFDD